MAVKEMDCPAATVEPAAFAGADPAELRLLYIALTRAVQHLSIVHAGDLPPALAA